MLPTSLAHDEHGDSSAAADDVITRIVDAAPPLSPATSARLTALLRGAA